MPSLRGLIIEMTGGSVHSHHRGKRDAVPPKSPTVKGRPTLRQQASILSIWRDSIEKRCELHETCGNSPYTDIMRDKTCTGQKWKCARKCIRFSEPERPVTVLTIHPDTLARVSVLQVGFSFSFHTNTQQGSVVPVRSFLEYTLEEHLFITIFSVVSTTCHCCALLLSGDEMEQGRGRAHRESASHRDVCSICFWTSNFIIIYI